MSVPRNRPGQVLGAVVPAVLMAVGSVALAVFQYVGIERAAERAKPEVLVQATPAIVETPPPPVVEPKVESLSTPKSAPAEPAVSDAELAAKRAEAARIAQYAEAVQARGEAESRAVVDSLEAWTEARRDAVIAESSSETAQLQVKAAEARAEALRKRRQELSTEIARIHTTPKPPREALSGFSPVAKPAKGQEYHFEVKGDRVAFIDLQQLLELVKKDFQVRMRLSGSPRGIQSEVGPVGDFGLAYEVGTMGDLGGPGSLGLKGWEVVPARDPRGETIERSAQPLSDFDRAIRRLSPTQATITMWVYPDGFGTFRVLRDRLHSQGFMVAARPLPAGVPVRGSPMGSISAGQ